MDKKIEYWFIIPIALIVISGISPLVIYVFGASLNTSTIDNAGRREYGYCPMTPESLSSRAQIEVNGCPLVRVFITNWNQLSSIDQSTIDSQMRALGFKDIGEFDNRVK